MSSNTVVRSKVTGRFVYPKKKGLFFDSADPRSVSRTQQNFAKEADINNIIAKYNKTGLLLDPTKVNLRSPQFGDFSNVRDFQTAQNKLLEVQRMFESLPAKIREMFKNDTGNFVAWMSDPKNLKDAEKLGLVSRDLKTVRYLDKDGNDITNKVIADRGLYINGIRVNADGSPYVDKKSDVPAVTKTADVKTSDGKTA